MKSKFSRQRLLNEGLPPLGRHIVVPGYIVRTNLLDFQLSLNLMNLLFKILNNPFQVAILAITAMANTHKDIAWRDVMLHYYLSIHYQKIKMKLPFII